MAYCTFMVGSCIYSYSFEMLAAACLLATASCQLQLQQQVLPEGNKCTFIRITRKKRDQGRKYKSFFFNQDQQVLKTTHTNWKRIIMFFLTVTKKSEATEYLQVVETLKQRKEEEKNFTIFTIRACVRKLEVYDLGSYNQRLSTDIRKSKDSQLASQVT